MNSERRSEEEMNKKIFGIVGVLLIALTAGAVLSKSGGGGGYDEYGYNYQAHIFNGRYCDYDRVIGGPYSHVTLVMKWNDAWLSNKDRDGDGELDRHYGYPSYIGSGAWCTNHQYATEDDGTHWVYFVKIVALDHPVGDYEEIDGILFYDDVEVGILIWGQFAITQRVYNEEGGPHGIEYLVQPAGFGASG